MEPEINPTEEALVMQSIEQNDKLDEIAKTNEASVLEQASTTEAIKELTPALEAILIKLDEVASRETQKVELVGPQITAIKGDKGDKGNTPTTEELEGLIKPLLPTTDDLLDIIEPLIPEPIKGDDGEDYILTENDKKEIASFIEVPIVEKVIEKTVIEKPVTIDKTKTVIKEVAKYESADDIVAKLNTLKKAIDFSVIKNFPDRQAYFGGNTQVEGGISNITGLIIDGTNTTVSGSGTLADPYAINATGGGSPALTQNYVGFGDASNLLTGDASFQYLIDTHSLQFGESSIALISASNRGAFAHGYAVGDGFGIFASSDGSSASGCADEATISATSNGAFVNGFSFSNGSLIADGDGSTTFGIAGSYGVINSNGAGSLAFGSSSNIGIVQASGEASFAHGFVDFDGSSIVSSGTGSTASGYATNEFSIMAIGNGSLAGGYTDNGGVSVTGNGAFGWGDKVTVDGDFATAFGSNVTNTASNSFLIGYGGGTGLFVNNSNNVGIGTTTPVNKLHISLDGTVPGTGFSEATDALYLTSNSQTTFRMFAATSVAGNSVAFGGVRTRGTVASPTIVQSGDTILNIFAQASDGTTARKTAAQILFSVDGTPGANDMPGRITFLTTPDGSTSQVERMRIDNAGNIGFGTTNPLAPIELRATRATIAFESSGLTGNMPFTDTASLGAWASTSYIGAINQMSQANGGLAFQGFTNSASLSAFALAGHVGSTTPTAAAVTISGWKSNGTTGRTAMTGAEKLLDITPGLGTAVFTLTANGSLGLGDNTPATNASRLSIVGGTGTTGIPFQYLSGTLSTTGSGTGAQYLITSPATAGTYSHAGLRVEFLAGYTGTGATRAFYSDNQVAGTGSDLRWNTSYSSPTGNSGGNMWASATTTGTNVGNFAEAKGGNVNVGLFGKAAAVKNSATNIGVIGHGRNTGTSPIQVGGWFSLANTAPTFVSAALVADNGDQTSPIFLARDNSTTVFSIVDGGNVGIGTATPNASASLDVSSTTRGFLPPRMTTAQRDAISSPAAGLVIYNTTTNKHQGYDGSVWNDFY